MGTEALRKSNRTFKASVRDQELRDSLLTEMARGELAHLSGSHKESLPLIKVIKDLLRELDRDAADRDRAPADRSTAPDFLRC